eukprot:jgi/Ulvmu1/9356/UM050_0108.1
MFASQAKLFEDELIPHRQPLQSKPVSGKSGKGLGAHGKQPVARTPAKNADSSAQSVKTKRRALANITNDHAKSGGNTGGDNAAEEDLPAKPAAAVIQKAESKPALPQVMPPSPEKLVGPTGRDMEEAAAAAENKLIEEKVSRLLRALEGAWDDDASDISRDFVSGVETPDDLRDLSPICADDLGPLPECPIPPLCVDLIDTHQPSPML